MSRTDFQPVTFPRVRVGGVEIVWDETELEYAWTCPACASTTWCADRAEVAEAALTHWDRHLADGLEPTGDQMGNSAIFILPPTTEYTRPATKTTRLKSGQLVVQGGLF